MRSRYRNGDDDKMTCAHRAPSQFTNLCCFISTKIVSHVYKSRLYPIHSGYSFDQRNVCLCNKSSTAFLCTSWRPRGATLVTIPAYYRHLQMGFEQSDILGVTASFS